MELREQAVVRNKAKTKADGTVGPIDLKKTKQTARKMLNGESGHKIQRTRKRRTQEELDELRETARPESP